jgi:hypothetical protein
LDGDGERTQQVLSYFLVQTARDQKPGVDPAEVSDPEEMKQLLVQAGKRSLKRALPIFVGAIFVLILLLLISNLLSRAGSVP